MELVMDQAGASQQTKQEEVMVEEERLVLVEMANMIESKKDGVRMEKVRMGDCMMDQDGENKQTKQEEVMVEEEKLVLVEMADMMESEKDGVRMKMMKMMNCMMGMMTIMERESQ
jgi:hypothetical protein